MKKKRVLPVVWLIIVYTFLYLPIAVLAFYSFTDASMIGQAGHFSVKNFRTLFTTPELLNMIFGTIVLALVVGVLSTVLGTFGAIGAFYSKKRNRNLIEAMNQVPVVNADVVTGFSVCILLVVVLGINKDTYIPLVAGQMALCTPFVYLQVIPALSQMDHRIYEAALDLYCTPGQAVFKVVLRQLAPAIGSGFFTAVTLSMDDYFVTTYTKPAVFDTISTYTVNATKGAQTEIKTALWALSALIFFIAVAVVIAANVRSRRVENP
ncbi:MAG: ABC transporter permease subunit [bacterium LCO1.1]|uniref:ABC transporter permease subunit n=1 Tax=Candidatus Weimeria bifida TaxID=2599074 RepID=A0A6N7IW09_9FIRM|nr:ABC transporter permease subunit [Candidatus Weimeria bifida]